MTVASELYSRVAEVPSLLYAVVGLAAVWYWRARKSLPDNIPPFPARPYPILGHVPLMKSNGGTLGTIQKWREKIGDVFSLMIGTRLVIVLNNLELMKEAFVKKGEYFSDRPVQGPIAQQEMEAGGLTGIIGNNGPNWKEQRSVSMQILREFGMGKNQLAEKVTEEVVLYLDTISKIKGQAKDFRMLTNAAVSNVICAILIGRRFDLDDPSFVKLLRLVNEQVTLLSSTNVASTFPFLKYLPGDFFNLKRILRNNDQVINLFSVKFLQEVKDTKAMNNFIGSYYDEIKKKENTGSPTSLDDKNLIRVIGNLFAAGSETTSTTIMWALMFAIQYPQTQEKFYKEVVELVGTERLPNMQDKPKMNYVNAFIMETQRLGSIVPLSLAHLCTKTVEIGGYTIPEGTAIIPNLDAVLKDEKTWGDPLVFRPERFLDENNKVVVPEQFIPFSIGRRYCMGEALARMELFLFIACLFQRFQILPEDKDNLPPPDPIFGVTSAPKAFAVKMVEREESRAQL